MAVLLEFTNIKLQKSIIRFYGCGLGGGECGIFFSVNFEMYDVLLNAFKFSFPP